MPVRASKRPVHFDGDGAVMSPLVFSQSSESSSSPNNNNNNTTIKNGESLASNRKKGVSFEESDFNTSTNTYRKRNVISPTSSSSTHQKHNREDRDDDDDGSPAFDPFAIHSGSGGHDRSFNKHHHHHQHNHQPQQRLISNSLGVAAAKEVLKKVKVLLPSTGHGKFGPIQYRADIPSMLFKKWHFGYWLHVYPATINVFDSMEDMRQWKDMNDMMHTSSVDNDNNGLFFEDSKATKRQMDKFVKASINFDTTGDLIKKMKKLEEKNRKLLGNSNNAHANGGDTNNGIGSVGSGSRPSQGKQKVGDCSNYNLPVNYVMENVRSKYYRKNDPLMHTFKISYLGLSGRNVSAAFGSTEPQEVKRLRAVIRDVIHLVKKASKKRSKIDKGQGGGALGDENGSTMSFSKVPYSCAKSELTALSNTVYGRNTMTTETARKFGTRHSRHTRRF